MRLLISTAIIYIFLFQENVAQDIAIPCQFFYVSPKGKNSNPGTMERPIADFHGAQKLVRDFKVKNKDVPVKVFFRGGKYYLTESLTFTPADGGSKTGPVTYLAYPGENPLILGGKSLRLNFKKFKQDIYQANVPKNLIFESLYVNDEEQILARYPNYDSQIRVFNGTAANCISPEKVAEWKDPEDGYFHVIHKALWGGFHYRITGKDQEQKLTMEGGWQNNRPENGLHEKLRYVENIFEELDDEKEWYLDRKKNILYYKPASGVNIREAHIEVAFLENFIKMVGTEASPVRYLSFNGFHFSRTIRTFMKTRDRLLRSDWSIYRGGAVFFEGTDHCSIVNCAFNQIGGNAIFVNGYNRDALIKDCHIYDIGASGICFVGDTSAVRNPKFSAYGPPVSNEDLDLTNGPKNNRYPSYCQADNNLIHDFGKVEKQTAGVQISMASYLTISHNSIYNCPRAGINISEGAWGGHLIEFNDVFNTVLETSDHGSFNSWGRDRFWMAGNQRTEKRVQTDRSTIFLDNLAPTIIRNNRMRCDHGWDIDLDDGSSNYHLYNNLCLKNGIKLREGYFRRVENNICVNNAIHPHVWLKDNGDIIRGNIFGSRFFPIRVNYWGTEIDFNWYLTKTDLKAMQDLGLDQNSHAGDPLFLDPKNGDFRAKPASKVFTMGWKNFAMDQFGVQKGSLKKLAKQPDIPFIVEIMKSSQETYDFFGGQIKDLETDEDVSATGMHEKSGILIVEVPIFGNITDYGLQKGDVILKVNNMEITDVRHFLEKKALFENKEEVNSIIVWRNQTLKVLGK